MEEEILLLVKKIDITIVDRLCKARARIDDINFLHLFPWHDGTWNISRERSIDPFFTSFYFSR